MKYLNHCCLNSTSLAGDVLDLPQIPLVFFFQSHLRWFPFVLFFCAVAGVTGQALPSFLALDCHFV